MINAVDFFKTELSKPLSIGDTTLQIPSGAVEELCDAMVAGTVIPLVISYSGNNYEIVSVQGKLDGALVIERAQFGTQEKNWPTGACVSFTWTAAILDEYICQVVATCPE